MSPAPSPAPDVRDAIRRDLTGALEARDRVAVAALRSISAALANAEAVPVGAAGAIGSEQVAGAVLGLGGAEADRRVLDADAVDAVVAREIDERTDAAATYRTAGAVDRAETLLAEAEILRRYRHC